MKETGLMFKAPLVRAILSGQKTQTRRVIKPQPDASHSGAPYWNIGGYRASWCRSLEDGGPLVPANPLSCPFGRPGDRIYVRETWDPDPPCDGTWSYTQWAGCRQGQIEGVPERFRTPEHCNYEASWQGGPMAWTPSIHMPKWAARIWLEITGVRVERLHDISESDALAEGISAESIKGLSRAGFKRPAGINFRDLWTGLGGDWDANPWVWAIDFKRVQPAHQGEGS